MRLVDEAADLAVDLERDLVRVVGLRRVVAAEEHLVLLLAERKGPDDVRHPVLGDHLLRDLRRALDVVRGARRDVADRELLGHAPPEEHRELVDELLARGEELILLWQRERVAERAAARDHADLVHGVGVRQHVGDERVAALVVGDHALLALAHRARLALGAGHHTVDGLLDLLHADGLLAPSSGQQRRLVDDVREVGAGEAGRASRDDVEVHALGPRLAPCVHPQDRLATLEVGAVHGDVAVEATRPQQRRVQDVGTVRRGHEDDRGALVEPVHLDEELVQGLLALVVPAAEPGAAMPADSVDLVDEHDRRGVLLRLLEQVAHASRSYADEHLDEVRPADGVEGDAGLARDRAREERLARPRRPEQEHAARDLRAHRLELRGVLQVLLDLLQLLDRLVDAGHIRERRLRLVLRDLLRPRLTELHHAPAARLRLVHDPDEGPDDQDHGDELDQEPDERRPLLGIGVDLDAALQHLLRERLLHTVGIADGVGRAVVELTVDRLIAFHERRRLHLARLESGPELVELHLGGRALPVRERDEQPDTDEHDEQVQRRAAEEPAVRRLGRGQRGSFRRSDLRRCFRARGARARTGPSAMLAQGSKTTGPPSSGCRSRPGPSRR